MKSPGFHFLDIWVLVLFYKRWVVFRRSPGVAVRLLAVYSGGGLCGCVAVLAVDSVLCTAVLMGYFDVATPTSRKR